MKKKNLLWMVSLLFLLGLSAAAYAENWTYLGNAHVDGGADHDNIKVGKHDGNFRAIQLRVSDGAIEFQRVVVHFGNGQSEEIVVREMIPSGGRTRAIDLPGERRKIESVELWYSKGRWEHKPKVELFGMR